MTMEALAYKQFLKLEDTHWWFIGRRRVLFSLLDRHLPPGGDRVILDVGCGYGGMLVPLARRGRVMGLEIDFDSARFCRRRGFEDICLGSGYALPFRTGVMDVVTLFDTIEHIDDDLRVVRECTRILRPGGLLVVSVPAYQFLYADNDRIAHHRRRYTLTGLKRTVRAAGLRVRWGTYYNVLLFPVILPVVLLLKLKQALRGPLPEGRGSTNLSYRAPRPAAFLLEKIFSSERLFLPRVPAPFGHSIALLAEKPPEG